MNNATLQCLIEAIDENDLWEDHLVLDRHQLLKRAGESDTRVYWVKEGCLRFFIRADRKEHSIRFGYAGDLVAALDSFITEEASPLEVQALRRTEVKLLSKSTYKAFMEASEDRRQLWNLLLEQLVHQQMEREYDLLINSPLERYKRVLKRSPRLFQEVPLKYIASYLRMTPETLSRVQNS